ncbi:MAG: lysophospholipid acyltransferase family protein [Pseudomonadota bacterium]
MAQIMRIGLWLAQLCSSKTAWRLAGVMAWLMQVTNSDLARINRINIQACFAHLDAHEQEAMCRLSLRHLALLVFEFAQLAHWPDDKLLGQIVEVEGLELLEAAIESKQGVLLMVPHFGNWEVLCAFLGKHYALAALYDPPKIASLEPVMVAARQRYEAQMFPIDTGGIRSLIKVLRSGSLVAILPDQVPDRSAGVHADFFGRPALSMTLSHRLISKNQPCVLMGSVTRLLNDKGYSYRVCFEKGPAAGATDLDTATSINAAIEKIVRRAPEQYQWEYKRFKRPPEEAPDNIYRRQ